MPLLLKVGSFLISSLVSRVAASLGNCSLHPIVTAVCVIQSHLISYPLSFFQLFSADHNCSHISSCQCHPSPSDIFSAHLSPSLFSLSQLLHSTRLVSTQLFSALHGSSHVSSSQLFTALLMSARLNSALHGSSQLSSSQLFTALLNSALLSSSPLF